METTLELLTDRRNSALLKTTHIASMLQVARNFEDRLRLTAKLYAWETVTQELDSIIKDISNGKAIRTS